MPKRKTTTGWNTNGKKKMNKDTRYEERKVAEWQARLAAKQQARESGEELAPATTKGIKKKVHLDVDDDRRTAEMEFELRISIKLLWKQLGKPGKDQFDGRDGTVAEMRRRLDLAASQRNTIRRTLALCLADSDLKAVARRGGCKRKLCESDERIVADLLISGFGQQQARHQINMLREGRGEAHVQKDCIIKVAASDGPFEMMKRKRRRRAAGSTDKNSEWAMARLAQCQQFLAQLGVVAAAPGVEAPPEFCLEQIDFWDEHHEKCMTGCVSPWDYVMPEDPENAGVYMPLAEGGQYPGWHDRMVPKHEQEVRFLCGVGLSADGTRGERRALFEYTGKTVLGVAAFEKAIKAEVARVNALEGGGPWAHTNDYDFASLPGGRYQAWIAHHLNAGEIDLDDLSWRDDVIKHLRGADFAKGTICVTEMIDHVIAEGERAHPPGSRFHGTWMIYHDHLSQWWEEGAQNYLRHLGYYDRQVRCVGVTNAGSKLYRNKVVGNSYELMPLDNHLFSDVKTSVRSHAVWTANLDREDPKRFKMGTPRELSCAFRRVWDPETGVAPTSERIVQDIRRWPGAVQAIVDHDGAVVPSLNKRTGRRKASTASVMHADAVAAHSERLARYAREF